ncbi:MAG: TetR/AcrR family transcriptional regulator [Thermonemataceae bacterium]|nr:TetR/AcrR family transcriptional regulator [Thermonemataceae bacterium]
MIGNFKVEINEKIYLRNPDDTALGRKIIRVGIQLIEELGFESFTFKKLAEQIQSTEASVYRYFENKHKFLVYIINLYWYNLSYQIDYQCNNIENKELRLKQTIRTISEFPNDANNVEMNILHKIVVSESPKAYHTKYVDEDNQDGFFRSYKSLCKKIADSIKEVFPSHPYSLALSSTLLETSHLQIHFSKHLPSLTEVRLENENHTSLNNFLDFLVFGK